MAASSPSFLARATSACVKAAGRRDIGLIDPVGKRKCHDDGCARAKTEWPKRAPRHAIVELLGLLNRAVPLRASDLRVFPEGAVGGVELLPARAAPISRCLPRCHALYLAPAGPDVVLRRGRLSQTYRNGLERSRQGTE